MIEKSVCELSRLIQDRQINVTDVAEQYSARIKAENHHYRALETFSEASFSLLAETAQHHIDSDQPCGPLHGIPILVDDLIDVANLRTTYGCVAYADNVPEVDAMVVRRLRAAGALFPGKSATAELGLIDEESQDDFVCRSPWGDNVVSGGGSSGATVGLVKQFGAAAVALDVGANVLLPAAFNGVFALVPSYGRIAHTPIYSHGTMFASVALVTRDVADCALMMNVVAGHSEVDPLSARYSQIDYQSAMNRPVAGFSIALAQALWNAPCDDHHKKVMVKVEKALKSAQCRIDHQRPPIRDSVDAWETVFAANLFTTHGARFSQQPAQFGPLATQFIENGETITAANYIEAQKGIYGLRLLLREYFEQYDALIIPAAGCLPFAYETTASNLQTSEDSVTWRQYASMCSIAAISGFPTAHLPAGSTRNGLPTGVLVLAKPGDEDLLLALCLTLEQAFQ